MNRSILLLSWLALAVPAFAQNAPAAAPPAAAAPADQGDAMGPPMAILGRHHFRNSDHAEGALIAAAAFAFTLLIVLATLAFRRITERERHETMRRIIEKGGQIPPELLGTVVPQRSVLSRGITLCAVGVGLATFFLTGAMWSWGLLLVLLGLGYLLSWVLESKKAA
ncbi:MAG TPA: DUF6249 domain-containing protein [Myxococcales bacterium]|nr:DUF6249 domain-containing protein [Myxococcales bacterium]